MFKQQILEAFQLFDTDKSNSIDSDELRVVLTAIGMEPTKKELIEITRNLAKNGEISFDDFYVFMSKQLKSQPPEFNYLNSGNPLNLEDLIKLSLEVGEALSKEEAEELMQYCDLDGDGFIGLQDYENIKSACANY
eukprot:NODE_110_length_18645_cov_0.794403.p16 type:complete len:136 gc:universal NODE_110_length_18645_cov_0.794403:8304-8711(+)